MKEQYFPFLVAASQYADYWAIICPENVRPLIISKATIRGADIGQFYCRKIVFEDKKYEILYTYVPVQKKHMSGDEKDDGILFDKTGTRQLQMFYGVFGVNIPLNSKLMEISEEYIVSHLPAFLNDKEQTFSLVSQPFDKLQIGSNLMNDLEVIKLEDYIIEKDIFITEQIKPFQPLKEVKTEIGNTDNENPKPLTDSNPVNRENIDRSGGDSSDAEPPLLISPKKLGGLILTVFGLVLAAYSGKISFASAVVTGAGLLLILSDKKSEPNEIE